MFSSPIQNVAHVKQGKKEQLIYVFKYDFIQLATFRSHQFVFNYSE